MSTYSDMKSRYEEDQRGMQQGVEQAFSSSSVSDGVGTLIGLGVRSSRMSQQNAKIEAINQAVRTASAQLKQGLYEEAIVTATSKIISSDMIEAKINGHNIRGLAYFCSGQDAKAIEDLTLAIEMVENSSVQMDQDALGDVLVTAYWTRGRVYSNLNQTSEALRDFTRAIRLQPDWEHPYYSRCLVLRTIGEYDRALADINQAISIEPGDADNYRERGQLYALTGASDKAHDDLTRAITLKRNVVNLRARGQFYAGHNEASKALADYSEALALDPDNIETLKLRAETLKSLGSHAEAEADLLHIAASERRQSDYQRYLDTAKVLYEKGITRTWTEADTKAKPNYIVAVIVGILTFVGVLVAVIAAASISVVIGSDSGSGLCLLAGLLLAPVLGIVMTINRINEPKRRAQMATQFLDEMATQSQQMPRFSEFYEAYLKARADETLSKLRETTQPIFAMQ